MPDWPTTISAATITNQAVPIEIRMPVRIIGTAAGNTICRMRVQTLRPSTRDTLSQSCRTADTPNAVLISNGQTEQMKMIKIAEAPLSFKV